MHENQQSHIEGIFSRGDRRVADVLEAAFRLGCRFDSWDDALRIELWDARSPRPRRAPASRWRATMGTMPVTARLPWDHIDIGLEPDFLAKEYRKALKDRLSPPCGKPFKKLLHPSSVAAAEDAAAAKLICYDCGIACDLGAMKEERLFYLRRMNAWLPSETKPAARAPIDRDSAPGEKPAKRRAPQPPARVGAGDVFPLPAPLHEAGARRVPRSPGPGAAPATHHPAGRLRPLLLGRAFTRSPSCRTDRRWGSGSRRWASWST